MIDLDSVRYAKSQKAYDMDLVNTHVSNGMLIFSSTVYFSKILSPIFFRKIIAFQTCTKDVEDQCKLKTMESRKKNEILAHTHMRCDHLVDNSHDRATT